jgi:hypothetical protein
MLLAGVLGIASTAASRSLSHSISWGVTLAIGTNLAQLMLHKVRCQLPAAAALTRPGCCLLLLTQERWSAHACCVRVGRERGGTQQA